MINADYPSMKVMFLPDTSITLLPLQLGAMYELHAQYKTVVMHNVMEQNAATSIILPNNNVIALHCVLYALRSAYDLAVVSGWLASGLVPLSGIQTYSISG